MKIDIEDYVTWQAFINESNKIEGILRPMKLVELEEFHRFMNLKYLTVEEIEKFVSVYQPNAKLRISPSANVMVGNHFPPKGGDHIFYRLQDILAMAYIGDERNAYETHHAYESLHPFTDGNGRSGRMIWMWQMRKAPLGFLHTWYYQSLSFGRDKNGA